MRRRPGPSHIAVALATVAAIGVHSVVLGAQAAAGAAAQSVKTMPWAQSFLSRQVTVRTDHGKVRGKLISADDAEIVIGVRNPELWVSPRYIPTPVKFDDVRRVSVQKDDSIVNGAIIGAAAICACLKWYWCGQGFDGEHNGRDWTVAIAVGALLGGGFDSGIHSWQEIYRRPDPVRAEPTASTAAIRFRVSF
jgi:hypothetical protein